MAGFVHFPTKPGRKQWTLHDGPRGSLRRLRSQLAEDGCPESQVVLAKQLLEERSDLDNDKEENARLGVYWLTKASEQGNLEATNILRQCLATGRGITEHNYYDVKNCLDMPQDEKLARKAAREMFTSLSNGEEFITTKQLQRHMQDSMPYRLHRDRGSGSGDSSQSTSKKVLDDSIDHSSQKSGYNQASMIAKDDDKQDGAVHDWLDHQGEKITEAVLVSAATSYARGMLPIVSHALCMREPSQLALDELPLLQRGFIHPLASLKRLYIWLVETIGCRAAPIRKLIFTSHIHTLILLILYSLLGTESLVLFVPMALYYLSFIIMVISTFQILERRRELNDFRVWSGLFLRYSNGNLNSDEPEHQFCRNNLRPYAHFFLALLVNLLVYPIMSQQWAPHSEFTIVAITLTLVTLLNFMWNSSSRYPDFLALFSFGVHVLAKYPYETDIVVAQTWRFLDIKVPTFASYVVGNGIEFCLNFRAVFYLLIPAVFLKMAARDSWKGIYQILIPHCVTLSWWQIAILSSQSATWYGLIRGALALVGTVFFLPIVGLASIILPIVAAAKYLSESDVAMKVASTTILGGMPFIASWIMRKTRVPRFSWIITIVQLILAIAAGMFLSWPILTEYKENPELNPYEIVPTLSWEQYQNHCHQSAWEELPSKAQVQVQCANLEGIHVSWEGYVTNVRLNAVENNVAALINKMPDSVKFWVNYMFSKSCDEKENCQARNDPAQRKNCKFFMDLQRRKRSCHLAAWNRYEFEIVVKMKGSMWSGNAEVTLIADNSFANFSLNVYPGDKIWFSGTLLNGGLKGESLLGGSKPHIDLEEIGCLACHSHDLKPEKKYRYQITLAGIASNLYQGIKFVLNFLLNPIILFK